MIELASDAVTDPISDAVFNPQVNPKSDWAVRVRCYGTWELRDCWVAAAQQKCDAMQTKQVHNLPYTLIPNLKKDCENYPPGNKIPSLLMKIEQFIDDMSGHRLSH